jgi:teichoic acid transport system ATP-binding protein
VVRTNDATQPVAVSFERVTKAYHVSKIGRKQLINLFFIKDKGEASNHAKAMPDVVYANRHLTFTIKRGESVALIGRNGAGKSTAIKMITGVIYPTRGKLEVHGKVSGLLELSAGFDGRLTGAENIRLRAQIAGFSAKQIERLLPGIIEFAELEGFINQPLRTYSSGMKARLGFAFASSINPDILLVDEALSVGDAEFQRKCRARVKEMLARENLTVILVTHAFAVAQQFCVRGIVIDKGRAVFDGPIADAITFYKTMTGS